MIHEAIRQQIKIIISMFFLFRNRSPFLNIPYEIINNRMGRGGRGGGHHGGHGHFGGGHRSHFGGHHHHHGFHSSSYRGGGSSHYSIESTLDSMALGLFPPTLLAGIYTFSGNHVSLMSQVDSLSINIDPLTGASQGLSIQQIQLTLVGSKTKAADICCLCSTFMFGVFCILPLFCMCTNWWKKKVSPAYELSVQAYRIIANFISYCPNANSLNLVVADSTFNPEKARILYETLCQNGRITTFGFQNLVLDVNYQNNEADTFRDSMLPIKSLNVTSSIIWGDMIL